MGALVPTLYLPVAYLPGASGRAVSWEPIASVLAYRREPRLFDYPGLGDHAEVPGINDLADLTHWIASGLPPLCDVITLSMGSTVGLRLALDYPERVRRLVLVTPCGGFDVRPFGALDWRETFCEQRPEAPRWFVDDTHDLTPRLGELSIPTLVVMGDEDPIAPPAIGEFLLRRLPAAKLEIVQDAGHDLEEEHPAFLASLIEAHLRR
ncbi:MAG: alpha/beta fold hydrolase [Polyangiaceae bacterium]